MNFTHKGRSGDHWATPDDVYTMLDKEFKFNYDPCPLRAEFDGLNSEWGTSTFVNPPYSNVTPWIEKAISEGRKNKRVVMLLKFDPSTKWFNNLIWPHSLEIRLITKRLRFNNKDSAPFASMVCVLRSYSTPGVPQFRRMEV